MGGNKRIQWDADACEDIMAQDMTKFYLNSNLKRMRPSPRGEGKGKEEAQGSVPMRPHKGKLNTSLSRGLKKEKQKNWAEKEKNTWIFQKMYSGSSIWNILRGNVLN